MIHAAGKSLRSIAEENSPRSVGIANRIADPWWARRIIIGRCLPHARHMGETTLVAKRGEGLMCHET